MHPGRREEGVRPAGASVAAITLAGGGHATHALSPAAPAIPLPHTLPLTSRLHNCSALSTSRVTRTAEKALESNGSLRNSDSVPLGGEEIACMLRREDLSRTPYNPSSFYHPSQNCEMRGRVRKLT